MPTNLSQLRPGDRFQRVDSRQVLLLLDVDTPDNNAACLETGFVYSIPMETLVQSLALPLSCPRTALKQVLAFRPDGLLPSDVARLTGWPVEDVAMSNGIWFLSESFLYPLMGKGNARDLLNRLDALCKTLGFTLSDIEMQLASEENNPSTPG